MSNRLKSPSPFYRRLLSLQWLTHHLPSQRGRGIPPLLDLIPYSRIENRCQTPDRKPRFLHPQSSDCPSRPNGDTRPTSNGASHRFLSDPTRTSITGCQGLPAALHLPRCVPSAYLTPRPQWLCLFGPRRQRPNNHLRPRRASAYQHHPWTLPSPTRHRISLLHYATKQMKVLMKVKSEL
jgi:hypothetical protein